MDEIGPLTIGEISRRSGLVPSAVRYYESEGLIAPRRNRSGRRVFDQTHLRRLALIRLARSAGFSIRELRGLLQRLPGGVAPGRAWRRRVAHKRSELATRLRELRRMLAVLDTLDACECPDLDACGRLAMRSSPSGSG